MSMLDDYDRRILRAWQAQGDLGPVEMSAHIHLSPSQCSRRMQRLRRDGYVDGIRALLSAQRLNVGLAAYVLLVMRTHEPAALTAFNDRMAALDEVLTCDALTGEADMILKVATRDLASFNRLLSREILGIPQVASARSSIILESRKTTTALPLDFLGDARSGA
jgi:DNA-binding Lrp family transcriptional regulator